MLIMEEGPSWLWSYGSWIYNYLCNQWLSPLTLWPPWYNWSIVESGIKHHNPNPRYGIPYFEWTLIKEFLLLLQFVFKWNVGQYLVFILHPYSFLLIHCLSQVKSYQNLHILVSRIDMTYSKKSNILWTKTITGIKLNWYKQICVLLCCITVLWHNIIY